MSQHDMNLANQSRTAFRQDANNALVALVGNSSGATEPATMFAYQWWADTTTGLLKIRNAANSAWVTVGTLASANFGLAPAASPTFTGQTLITGSASASAPGLAFVGDPNTGIDRAAADTLDGVAGGTVRWRATANFVQINPGLAAEASLKLFAEDANGFAANIYGRAADGQATIRAFNSTGATITGALQFRGDGSVNLQYGATPTIGLKINATGALLTGASAVAAGYTAAGSITLPADGAVRAQNTAKAWVSFNGTGTPAILDSFNVTSITDNGTGDYTINLTNATTNANGVLSVGVKSDDDASRLAGGCESSQTTRTTTAVRVRTFIPATGYYDFARVDVNLIGE